MKKILSLMLAFLLMLAFAGCNLADVPGTTAGTTAVTTEPTQTTAATTEPTQTTAPTLPPEPNLPDGRELTHQEVQEFEDLFMYDMIEPENNWYNYALKSVYETPAQLDLFEYFYSAPWMDLEQGEDVRAFLKEKELDPDIFHIHEYPVEMMDEKLSLYFGITVEETDKVGLDQMIYHPESNAYYHGHGDIGLSYPNFKKGVETPDGNISIYYTDTRGVNEKIVTITPREDGGYRVLSNIPAF